jgi:thiamine biosynthesis lipoprotein ApbE
MSNFQLFNASEFLMHTRFEMVVWGIDTKISEIAFKEAVESTHQLELVLSFYDQNSETFKLNSTGFHNKVKVSKQLWNYLLMANTYADKTHSFFNVALGNVYNKLKKNGWVDLKEPKAFSELVKLDFEDESIKLLEPDVAIDFGGIGKGIALKETERILQKFNIENVFVSFGESSILTKGRHPHGKYWPFSLKVEHADFEIKLKNDAVSISNAKQWVNGENRLHIINPQNYNSLTNEKMVIVQSSDPIDAEVLSTALVASPTENHKAILENFKSAKVCFY